MNRLFTLSLTCLLLLSPKLAAIGGISAYTSLWVFGDGVCTTTQGPGGSNFYGNRYCNGRVWVEVLAEWQGLSYDADQNLSYFGQDSDELLANLANHAAPADVATALYIIWSGNADFVEFTFANPPAYSAADLPDWSDFIADSVADHRAAIEDLHAKGVRHLVLPSAADIASAPFFAMDPADAAFIRTRIDEFNGALAQMVGELEPSVPGMTIHLVDIASFLDDVLANPGDYGVHSPETYALLEVPLPPDLAGPGADYVFWDDLHPTARVQMHIADVIFQAIAPPAIETIAPVAGGCRLDLVNVPVGRDGVIDGSGDLNDWSEDLEFAGINANQSVIVPSTEPARFFRARYPVVWTWP